MIPKMLLGAVALSLALLGMAGAAPAAGFPEKNITLIIPFSPGGGTDSTARQIAKIMSRYLPNKVNVVLKNSPGAGGRKAYGLLNRAKPDGYTISVINMPGAAIPQLTGQRVSFDITEFVWISRMSVSPYLLVVSQKAAVKSLADIKNLDRPLKMANTGFGSTEYAVSSITKHVVGFKATHLTGYTGSKSYIIAIIRGDAEAAITPTRTVAQFVESGEVRAIVTFEAQSSFPGVPTIAEAGYPELTGLGVQHMIAAPQGLPINIQEILSDAVDQAIQDADSQGWAVKTGRPFNYLSAAETQAAVDKAIARFQKYPKALEKQN